MCLIIASPEGLRPDMDIVANAVLDNPHGWGVVSAHQGKLTVTRGFRLPGLYRAIRKLKGPYLIHFRLATHGAVNIGNCHPFKVNPDCYMVHNGILRIPLIDTRYSDSWHFAANYVRPYLVTHGYSNLIQDAEQFIGRYNKLAFIQRNGEVLIANELAGTWKGGLWYSNDHSFPWDLKESWVPSWYTSRSPVETLEPLSDGEDFPMHLEGIVCDLETPCEYCETPVETLYYEPETRWYVCGDCARILTEDLIEDLI